MVADVDVRLSVFLSFLGSGSEPDAAARSMLDGPLTGFTASGVALQIVRGGELVTVGVAGDVSVDDVAAGTMPLTTAVPAVRAYHAGHTVIAPVREHRTTRPAATSTDGGASVVASVITTRGVRVGTWWTVCRKRPIWTPADHALINGISAALGLWLTRPDIDRGGVLQHPRNGFRLSARQQRILLLIEEGKTTAAIATALGYSGSTIKLDVRGILDQLDVNTRADAVRAARALNLLPT